MNVMERKNTDLIKEFNRYVREHPDFTAAIPQNAFIIMQLEGDEEFNCWSRQLAKICTEKDEHVVYVRIKKIMPIRTRIKELELCQQIA